MSKLDEFVNDCRRELDRHEYRLRTEEDYVWGYLASWFKECRWPEGTSNEEKLMTLEYLLYVTPQEGHRMAIKEAIRRLKAGMSSGKQTAVCLISIPSKKEIDDFTAAVNSIPNICYATM